MKIIELKRDELYQLCEKYKADKLYIFGSVLTAQFNPEKSDIDFLVEMQPMPPLEKGENLMALWSGLEEIFARKVDLLTTQSLKNPYLMQEIERTKKLIYDRQSQKTLI